MSIKSSNRTDVLGIYTTVLKYIFGRKLLFESKEFSAKEFAYTSFKLCFQCELGFCRYY